MVLFIVYHFYIDYKNWSNTGNTFAEGFSASEERLTGKGADYRGKQNMKQNRTKLASAMLAQLKANQERILAQG